MKSWRDAGAIKMGPWQLSLRILELEVDMSKKKTEARKMDIGIGEPNRKRWLKDGKCSFLPEERDMLQTIKDWGLIDTFRQLYPERTERYSWFDYRSKGFDDNRGLRIDVVMATAPLAALCAASDVDYEIRAMERPSDHAPVWSEFTLA